MRMMKMMTVGLVLAAVVAATGTARAGEVAVPAQAVNNDVPVVVWIDLQTLRAEDIRASTQHIANMLPESMAEMREPMMVNTDEGLEEIGPAMDALREAGAIGFLFVVAVPGEAIEELGHAPAAGDVVVTPAAGRSANDAHIHPAMLGQANDGPMVLVHVAPGVTAEAINGVVREHTEEDNPTPVVPYADGWLRIDDPKTAVIEDGNEANAAEFRELLSGAGDAPIRVAVRVTDDMKQQITAQGQADPMMAGFTRSLESLDTAWTTISFGEQPTIANRLNFENAEAAAEFNAAWQGILMLGEGMVTGQLAQVPGAPGPETVRGLFQSLKMQQEGESLSLTLGDQFLGQAAEFAPAAMGMAMMMMGGNGMQPPPQQQQEAPQQPMF